MLQNRVDPFGSMIRTGARGAWMGNRGLIHNDQQEIIRPFKSKAWITCRLEFKGWKRKVMSPGKYTELFFLDEATAFAAGHRPCFECRRDDATRFKSFWLSGNPGYGFDQKTTITKIDDILHEERIDGNQSKIIFSEKKDTIPNGTFVLLDNKPCLFFEGQFFLWSPVGYTDGMVLSHPALLQILTPRSIVNTFMAGYAPQIADLPVSGGFRK